MHHKVSNPGWINCLLEFLHSSLTRGSLDKTNTRTLVLNQLKVRETKFNWCIHLVLSLSVVPTLPCCSFTFWKNAFALSISSIFYKKSGNEKTPKKWKKIWTNLLINALLYLFPNELQACCSIPTPSSCNAKWSQNWKITKEKRASL